MKFIAILKYIYQDIWKVQISMDTVLTFGGVYLENNFGQTQTTKVFNCINKKICKAYNAEVI